jgi:diguanylate cyclase
VLTVYNCIAHAHDLRLVGLAALICALASFTAINLLHHVRSSRGVMRNVWLGVSAAATGFGIWATHFIAMLAFSPGIPSAYNIALTALSLLAAILLTGGGLALALTPLRGFGPWLGGAVVGAGIAAMHYTGMAAFEIQGRVVWDPVLVTASILLGGLIGAAALPVGLHSDRLKWKLWGAALLTLAICSHHFTAMAAAAIIPDPTIEVSDAALPAGLLAVVVAGASFVIIMMALAGVALELRDRRRGELETERMRGLANAAVEGLVVCDGPKIATVNDSFAALVGLPADEIVGRYLDEFFPDESTRLKLFERIDTPIEGELLKNGGARCPVELILRPVDFAGRPHRAIAVRDLEARKRAEQDIRFLAHHDALTGIPNRGAFNKKLDHEIEAAIAGGKKVAVLCLDLDRFKEVNDLFGHATGDRMLQSVARRVERLLDDNQTIARLSGDEFAIIVPGLTAAAVAGRIAENILEALRVGGEPTESDAAVSASIGIAVCPDDATDRQALLTHADTALYRAKHEGRGMYQFFVASMGAAAHDRRLLEHDLRQTVARKELRLVYQPLKEIRTGKIVGFEALLRWKHSTRGDVPPADFIPIAEETGAILPIGEWVLREACREAASWTEPLTVAVNVSAVQIHNADFAHLVHEILFQTGLTPSRLELEVTETALVRDLNRAVATLRRIKMLGVRIAMDDFGTGYSSLSNLRAFPFDKIKIDRSFIKSVNVNDQASAIVRSVLGLGRALGLPVLAEGVESVAELDFLDKESCDEAQGYLLGRPADIQTFRAVTSGEATTNEDAVVVPMLAKVSGN